MPGHSVAEVESLDRLGEVAHEIASAQLSVGENLKADLFLSFKDAKDVFVFERMKLLCRETGATRLQQLGGAKKTANVVGAIVR